MSSAQPGTSPRSALEFLWGARVQRVDAPTPTLFALTLYDKGNKDCLVLALTAGIGLVQERPTGQPASGFVRHLRTTIEGARLIEGHFLGGDGEKTASALLLSFLRGSDQARLAVDFTAAQPNVYVLDPQNGILRAADEKARRSRFPGARATFSASERGTIPISDTRAAALEQGAALLGHSARSVEQRLRSQATSQAKAALKRLTRKALAIREDLARAGAAPTLRREANLLLCNLAAVAPGANEVRLEDLASEPPEQLAISLDPALSALQNAERRFARARRAERGASIASERLAHTEAEIAALTAFTGCIEHAGIPELVQNAAAVGIKLDAGPQAAPLGGQRPRPRHISYRAFQGTDEARILVGKGAADNDALTLTVARPHDLWLHARGMVGAHVVVPRERGRDCPPEVLLDAAHLAAHFSDARGEPSAEIQYTERRYVRKPKGSPAGAVRVDRERVLLLRVEPERLRRLLAAELTP